MPSSGSCCGRGLAVNGAFLLDYGRFRFQADSQPETGKVAVKVVNHYGDEVLKVFGVG